MKKLLSIAALVLLAAGSTSFACGCGAKKATKAKAECGMCKKEGKACTACTAKKTAEKKAEMKK